MEFDVAEEILRYFVSDLSVEGNQHAFCEGLLHEPFHDRVVVSREWYEVLALGAESQSGGEFQKEMDVEVAEVALYGVQKQDLPFAPFEQSGLHRSVLDRAVQDLAHEHGHRVLVDVGPDAVEGVLRRKVPRHEQL